MTHLYTSQIAKIMASNDLVVFDEITAIARQVIIESLDGNYEATISDGTEMTDSVSYFDSWIDLTPDKKLNQKMNIVIDYFEKLGYNIQRQTDTSTNNTFIWKITW